MCWQKMPTQAGVFYVVYVEALIAATAPLDTEAAVWRTCKKFGIWRGSGVDKYLTEFCDLTIM